MVQSATMTGKPLIESDRVEGTTVYDRQGNNVGSIKRLMIEKLSGRVAYAVMSFGSFLGIGGEEHAIPWSKVTYDTRLDGYQTDISESEFAGSADLLTRPKLGLVGSQPRARIARLLSSALLLG
jgi:sporulation protein YlmC with PRC-barrel domain